MRAKLGRIRRIGNSKGVLIPGAMLEASGITDMVEIRATEGAITIRPVDGKKKKTWSDFRVRKKEKSDWVVNQFDSTDWVWE